MQTLGVFYILDNTTSISQSSFPSEFPEGTCLKILAYQRKGITIPYKLYGAVDIGILDEATASSRVDYGLGAEGVEDLPFNLDDLVSQVEYTLYDNPARQPRLIERKIHFKSKDGIDRHRLIKIHNTFGNG